jgi:hypothetical protein
VESFFERLILNPSYACPDPRWELHDDGQPSARLSPQVDRDYSHFG